MSTAISYVSESGDHYLDLFSNNETIEDIVSKLPELHGDELKYLYVMNCKSTCLDEDELEGCVTAVIEGLFDQDDEDE